MADVPREGAGQPRIVEQDVAPLIDAKTRALVEAERTWVIIGCGMHPQAHRSTEPAMVDRRLEEMKAKALDDEIGEQAEKTKIGIARGSAQQLKLLSCHA